MPRNKRIVVSLDDAAAEGLAELSAWLRLGEDALARRLLSAILNVIAGAMESKPNLDTPEAQVSPLEAVGGWEGLRKEIHADHDAIPEPPSSGTDTP